MDKWNGAAVKDLLQEYAEKEPNGFRGTTRPLKSTQSAVFTVLDAIPAGAVVMAHAVAKKGQTFSWFSYGVGEQVTLGAGLFKTASDADTNLSKGKKTNGRTDFVIQGLSATQKSMRIQYATASVPAGVADPDDISAYTGMNGVKLVDPGALIMVPQGGSPLNLEEVLFQALAPHISLRLTWDRNKFVPVGTLDQFPEGAGKSFLRANGLPDTSNRYKAYEGYLWRRVDETDSDFTIEGKLEDAVVLPFTLIALAGAAAPLVVPVNLFSDITIRVHGVGIEKIGKN